MASLLKRLNQRIRYREKVEWHLSGVVPTDGDRRVEVRGVEITQLDEAGPRPWVVRGPYIDHVQAYVGREIFVDMTDTYKGKVSFYKNDDGIPMRSDGDKIIFEPSEVRPLRPPVMVTAYNSAGKANSAVAVYLRVSELPAVLAAATPDPAVHAQLVHQYVTPGDALFPIDCDHLFTGGVPPFSDAILSAPSFVEMPVPGLLGGRCPEAGPESSPGIMTVTVQRTDSTAATANYTFRVQVTSARNQSVVHSPADGPALKAAMKAGGVVQLQPGVAYGNPGNLYGMAFGSPAEPVLVLGAPGAVISHLQLDTSGHIIFKNVAFKLDRERTLVSAKKVRGLRLVNCSFTGYTTAVDVNDGQKWMREEGFRHAGYGVTAREGSYVIIDECTFDNFNTAFSSSVNCRAYAVLRTTSRDVADDHCFFQQTTAIWFEEVDLLGHRGNHLDAEHRDIIQLANPNKPAVRKVLIRRVFGYGDGQSQGCFIRNEDQDFTSERLPYWDGSHRGLFLSCISKSRANCTKIVKYAREGEKGRLKSQL